MPTQESHTSVTNHVNQALKPLLQQKENFKEAPPLLFGLDFSKKVKDHVDQVKATRASLLKKGMKDNFFWTALPPRNGRGWGEQTNLGRKISIYRQVS